MILNLQLKNKDVLFEMLKLIGGESHGMTTHIVIVGFNPSIQVGSSYIFKDILKQVQDDKRG